MTTNHLPGLCCFRGGGLLRSYRRPEGFSRGSECGLFRVESSASLAAAQIGRDRGLAVVEQTLIQAVFDFAPVATGLSAEAGLVRAEGCLRSCESFELQLIDQPLARERGEF